MRILVTAHPLPGPVLPIARAARDAGHEVVVAGRGADRDGGPGGVLGSVGGGAAGRVRSELEAMPDTDAVLYPLL